MTVDKRALMDVQARAITAHDLETFSAQAAATTVCFRDGEFLGEGVDVVRRTLEEEYGLVGDLVGRVGEVDGDHVVIEYDGDGKVLTPRGVLRIRRDEEDRIAELRFEHDARLVARLAARGKS